MTSTFSPRLRLEEIGIGDQSNSWGTTLNTQLTLLDDAIAGVAAVDVTVGDYTLTVNSSATDEARRAIIKVGGTPAAARNVLIPSVSKLYLVVNNTGQTVTVKVSGQTGAAVVAGASQFLWCDGTTTSPSSIGYSASGNATIGGTLTVTGATTLGAIGGSPVPLLLNAASGAGSTMDLRGRATTNDSLVRFLSADGTTVNGGYSTSPTSPFQLLQGASLIAAMTMAPGGAISFAYNVSVGGSLTATGTISGSLLAPNGTAAIPSVRVGSENSGFYFTTAGYLHVAAAGTYCASFRSNGDFTAVGNVNFSSDRRLKRKLRRLRDSGAIVDGLKAYRAEWKHRPGEPILCLLAQEAQAADAALAGDRGDGYLALNVGGLLAVAMEELRLLRARVAKLEARGG